MPTFHEADTHLQEGRVDVAIQIYQNVLAENPTEIGAIKGLARCAEVLGLARQAEDAWLQVHALDPRDLDGLMRVGLRYQRIGRYLEAIACFSDVIARSPAPLDAHRARLQCLLYSDTATAEEREAAQAEFGEFYETQRAEERPFPNTGDPNRRLRIGYCSSDFHAHPVGMAMLPVLHFHDREKFEIISYADVPNRDGATDHLQQLSDRWRDIAGLSDDAAAALISEDEIDVLVVLAGHLDRNRLFIGRTHPAPIQILHHDLCSSFISDYDYFIGDKIITPFGGTEAFSERVLHMPCWTVQAIPAEAADISPPPFIENGFITFGSFNNPIKLSETTLSLWTRIISAVPESRLSLKYYDFYGMPEVRSRIVSAFRAAGIEPDRLLLNPESDGRAGHLSHYAMIDIALDPTPFNGATTTFEAMLMGVPVVCLLGDRLVSRSAASMVTSVGFPELAGRDHEAYVAIAKSLAEDRPRLAAMRAGLREKLNGSPVIDARRYTRNIERFYRSCWRMWCADQSDNII